MRDLAQKWSAVPDWKTAVIAAEGLAIRSLSGFSQCLVSGDIAAWSKVSGMAAEAVGALATATGRRYALRIARDRILSVSETPFDIAPGWHDEGFAVSTLDAGLHMFEIEGLRLASLLARATTLDPKGTTPSAAVLFAGVNALCCRHGHADRLRLHVDRGLAPYLWKWLEQASAL
jgi:hypothetical protein